MDTEVHGYILHAVLDELEVEPELNEELSERTSYPDIAPKENIKSFQLPDPSGVVETIFHGLQWIGNAIREFSQWGYDHSVAAVGNAMSYLREVLALCDRIDAESGSGTVAVPSKLRDAFIHDLAFTQHYIVDVGTPFHAKDFREIFLEDVFRVEENDEGAPKVRSNMLRLFFNIAYFFITHNKFEHDMRRYWNAHPGEYEAVIRSAIEALPPAEEDETLELSRGPFLQRFEDDLKVLKRYAREQYYVLYELYMEPLSGDERFKNGRFIQEFMAREYRGQSGERLLAISKELLRTIMPLMVRVLRYPPVQDTLERCAAEAQ